MKRKFFSLLGLLSLIANMAVANLAFADAESVTATVGVGSTLTVTAPAGDTTFATVTASSAVATFTVTTLDAAIDDARGTQAGWTVSSTATNLAVTGTSVNDASKNLKRFTGQGTNPSTSSVITVSGTYDGLNPDAQHAATGSVHSGDWVFNVTGVASNLPATITVTKPDQSATVTLSAAGGTTSVNGLTLTFATNASWTANSTQFTLRLDHFPYTALTPTPGSITATSNQNDAAGMTAGSATSYAGTGATSNSRTDYTASAGSGAGTYTFDVDWTQTVHKYPVVGAYVSTVTLTIN